MKATIVRKHTEGKSIESQRKQGKTPSDLTQGSHLVGLRLLVALRRLL